MVWYGMFRTASRVLTSNLVSRRNWRSLSTLPSRTTLKNASTVEPPPLPPDGVVVAVVVVVVVVVVGFSPDGDLTSPTKKRAAGSHSLRQRSPSRRRSVKKSSSFVN